MPVNTMAMPCSSAALITSSSRIEPPGWITAVAPASIATSNAVGEREERVGGHHRALGQRLGELQLLRGVLRLARGDARRIDPAHLAGADADGGAILGVDDGVRLDVLGDAERELQIAQLGVGRRALGHGLERACRRPRRCRGTAPAGRRRPTSRSGRPRADRAGRRPAAAAGSSSRATIAIASSVASGAMIDLGEDLGDRARGFGVERAVERDDAAEGRGRNRRRSALR